MAGLDPAIHVFLHGKGVDTRVKPAHDELFNPHPDKKSPSPFCFFCACAQMREQGKGEWESITGK